MSGQQLTSSYFEEKDVGDCRDSSDCVEVSDPRALESLRCDYSPLSEVRTCRVLVPQNEADAPVEIVEGVYGLGGVLEGEIADVPDDILSAHHAVPRGDDVFVVSAHMLECDVVPGIRAGGMSALKGHQSVAEVGVGGEERPDAVSAHRDGS